MLFFASTEPATGGMMETFGIAPEGLFAQVVIFFLIGTLLKKYAFDPVQNILDERRTRIAQSLSDAERIKKELAEAESTRKEIMRKAQDESDRVIAEAKKIASAEGEKKIQEAVAEAEGLIRKAREAIVLDREKMMADLRKEIVQLVVETTGKVSGKILTMDDQNRLKDETLKQMAA